jgi:hypothetical protein
MNNPLISTLLIGLPDGVTGGPQWKPGGAKQRRELLIPAASLRPSSLNDPHSLWFNGNVLGTPRKVNEASRKPGWVYLHQACSHLGLHSSRSRQLVRLYEGLGIGSISHSSSTLCPTAPRPSLRPRIDCSLDLPQHIRLVLACLAPTTIPPLFIQAKPQLNARNMPRERGKSKRGSFYYSAFTRRNRLPPSAYPHNHQSSRPTP